MIVTEGRYETVGGFVVKIVTKTLGENWVGVAENDPKLPCVHYSSEGDLVGLVKGEKFRLKERLPDKFEPKRLSDREILINLCQSLTLTDNTGDVSDAVYRALKLMGIEPPDDNGQLSNLGQWLEENHDAKGLWG